MKDFQIYKKIVALTIAGGMLVSLVACGNKNKDKEFVDVGTESIVDNSTTKYPEHAIIAGGSKAELEEETVEKKPQKDIKKYKPLDFKDVSDYSAKYKELLQERERYNKDMKTVVANKNSYSTEEVAYAIYNIVRIDNDLSCLLVKIYEEKTEAIKDDASLVEQIETLQDVLNKMMNLKSKIETAKKDFNPALDKLVKADVEQIERVQKFSLLPLNAPINKLQREIKDLKIELENSLAR